MQEFREQFNHKLPEVGSVRSLVYSVNCAKQHKNRTFLFHLLYALLCSILLFSASFGTSILSLICVIASPGMYAYTILYSPPFLKPLPAVLALIAFLIKLVSFKNTPFMTAASEITVLLMCLLISGLLAFGVVNGWSKIKMLTAAVAACTVAFITVVLAATATETGSISARNTAQLFDGFYQSFTDSYIQTAKDTISEDVFKQISSELNLEEVPSREEFFSFLAKAATDMRKTVKSMLPSMVITAFLILSYAIMGVFSAVVRLFKIDVFVCIMDNFWTYRIPMTALRIYDSLIFIFFLAALFAFPESFRLSIVNLFLIMSLPVAISCLGCLYGFLKSKAIPGIVSAIICVGAAILCIRLLGLWSVIILAVFANSILKVKEMKESARLQQEMAYNAEYAKKYREEYSVPATQDNEENK